MDYRRLHSYFKKELYKTEYKRILWTSNEVVWPMFLKRSQLRLPKYKFKKHDEETAVQT